jgi:hypothetical protein
VAVDTLIMNDQKDAEGEFFRQFGRQGSCGSIILITASGKRFGDKAKTWEERLAAFKELPPEERMPKVPELTNPDRSVPLNRLPKGALRIKLWSRGLERDARGELRAKDWKEYWSHEEGGDWPSRIDPGHDYLWLTEDEWQSLLPAEMNTGYKYALPKSLTKKLACDPLTHNAWARDPPIVWHPRHIRSLDLNLTVTDVSAGNVQMRVEGAVLLEAPLRDAFMGDRARTPKGDPISSNSQLKYDARMLGYLTYDRHKKAFTRFDIVALGDYVGFYCDAGGRGAIKALPLGVVFAVNSGPAVPPAKWHRDDRWWRD